MILGKAKRGMRTLLVEGLEKPNVLVVMAIMI